MTAIRLPVILVLASTLFVANVRSEEPIPNEMFDYLKPGMYVGMQRLDGETTIALNVFSDGQDGNLVVARSLQGVGRDGVDADDFAASHPAVRKQLDELKKEPAAQELQLRIAGAQRLSIGRIARIGTDFLLIELDDRSKRRLLPKASIAYIDLDADPATFVWTRRESKEQNGG